jgi:hypothetical protein
MLCNFGKDLEPDLEPVLTHARGGTVMEGAKGLPQSDSLQKQLGTQFAQWALR